MLGDFNTRSWLGRWERGDFAHSVVTLLGDGHGWAAVLPFLGAVAVAAVVLVRSAQPFDVREAPAAAGALLAWLVALAAAPDLLRTDELAGEVWGAVALVALVAAIAVALARPLDLRLVAAAPLLLLLIPGFASHTKQALAVAVVSLAAIVAASVLPRGRRRPA
jgi:hypothetical protein